MAIKNLIGDLQNALSIAQAGIKGTLKSLKSPRPKAKKPTARKRTSKQVALSVTDRKLKTKGKTTAKARVLRQSKKVKNRKSTS
ncbi:MAG: hypothetical protein L0H94_02235 [Nitrospira sp.]|nr:hypothetical protein [Nitrospira sp.]